MEKVLKGLQSIYAKLKSLLKELSSAIMDRKTKEKILVCISLIFGLSFISTRAYNMVQLFKSDRQKKHNESKNISYNNFISKNSKYKIKNQILEISDTMGAAVLHIKDNIDDDKTGVNEELIDDCIDAIYSIDLALDNWEYENVNTNLIKLEDNDLRNFLVQFKTDMKDKNKKCDNNVASSNLINAYEKWKALILVINNW